MESIGTWWVWAVFAAIVVTMLLVDLFAFGGGKQHRVSLKEAAGWSLAWVTVAMLFAAGLWWYLDGSVGAIVLRTIMIFAGSWLISEFHWILYIFGAFLVFIGTKMLIVDWIKIPVLVSLSVVVTVLACSVFASLWYSARRAKLQA